MKKSKKKVLSSTASKNNIIFGVIIIIFVFCLCILPLIRKATHSSEGNQILFTCPERAMPGDIIECSISIIADTMEVSGVSAEYRLTNGVEYQEFYLDSSFAAYNKYSYKDETGFVIVKDKIEGDLGLVSFKIPNDATETDVYILSLVDVIFADGYDEEISVDNVSATLRIGDGEEVTPNPGLSDINTLDDIQVSVGTLSPAFDKSINDYTLTIEEETVFITPIKTDPKSIVNEPYGVYVGEGVTLTTDIRVVSQSGKENIYSITITRKSDDFAVVFDEKLDIDDEHNYIKSINAGTTVEELLSLVTVTGGSIKLYDKNGTEKNASSNVGSGDTLKVFVGDAEKYLYVISVSGDIDGNGKVSPVDLVSARKHLVGYIEDNGNIYKKTGVYELALDLNGDGKVSVVDIVKIRKIIVGVK